MIKIGFNVSYDWMLLKKAVPRVYDLADKICFSIDKSRRTWKGQTYDFDEVAFRDWLKKTDVNNKIDLYEDDFALPGLTAMENDTRQRKLMAQRLGKGGWHLQIDSDEYFVNFKEFVDTLKKIYKNPTGDEKPLNVCVCCIPLIKKTKTGYLYVDFKKSLPEMSPVATTLPQYERARHSGHFNISTPVYVIHETWARSNDDLLFKISNWGHASDELKEIDFRQSYYALWKVLDEGNYQYVSDFHPAVPEVWPSLAFGKGDTVEDFIQKLAMPEFPLSALQLALRNNRNVARLKGLKKKIFS